MQLVMLERSTTAIERPTLTKKWVELLGAMSPSALPGLGSESECRGEGGDGEVAGVR